MATHLQNVGYLERGLWGQLFKLEHVGKGMAVALPTRVLIAGVLVCEKVGYPADLSAISRDFAGGKFEGMSAVNRVPYEVPSKGVLAFCPLEIGRFWAVIKQFQELSLLCAYEEKGAYNPGATFGGGPPIVVTDDGRFAKKEYFWEHRSRCYDKYLALVEKRLEEDAAFIDDFGGRVDEGRAGEFRKRLDFVDGCLSAARRDGSIPIVAASAPLLPMLVDVFPEHACALDVLRLLVTEMGRARITAEDLAKMRGLRRTQAVRAKLDAARKSESHEDVDADELTGALVDVIEEYSRGPREVLETRFEVSLAPKTWPNSQTENLPERSEWAEKQEVGERNLLVFWADTPQGRVCIGYTRRFFDCY